MTVDSSIPQIWVDRIFDSYQRGYIPTFIAGSYQQAAYWAENIWGFKPRQWRYANRPEDVRGLRPWWRRDEPEKRPLIWLCGTWWGNEVAVEAIDYLQSLGFEIVMAEDIE